MRFNTASSAPYLFPAGNWEQATTRASPKGNVIVLYQSEHRTIEAGIERWPRGTHAREFEADSLCYFMRGSGEFRSRSGEAIEAERGMAAHFKTGWRFNLEVTETLEASYMKCPGAPGPPRVLRDAKHVVQLTDWGVVPTISAGISRTAGILLSRDADRRAESGLWVCTPGVWLCTVTADEFCHFIDGRCRYLHES